MGTIAIPAGQSSESILSVTGGKSLISFEEGPEIAEESTKGSSDSSGKKSPAGIAAETGTF